MKRVKVKSKREQVMERVKLNGPVNVMFEDDFALPDGVDEDIDAILAAAPKHLTRPVSSVEMHEGKKLGRAFRKDFRAGPGRGTLPIERVMYDEAKHPQQIYRLRLLGLPANRIAEVLLINPRTLQTWRELHPGVEEAWAEGGEGADAVVANAMFRKAVGYEHQAVKIAYDPKDGEFRSTEYKERFAPDTAAGIFWLTNRQTQNWKHKKQTEHVGADGAPLQAPTIIVNPVMSTTSGPLIDYDKIDARDKELELKAKQLGYEPTEDEDE